MGNRYGNCIYFFFRLTVDAGYTVDIGHRVSWLFSFVINTLNNVLNEIISIYLIKCSKISDTSPLILQSVNQPVTIFNTESNWAHSLSVMMEFP